MSNAIRTRLRDQSVSTYFNGNTYETVVIDSYGRTLKSLTAKSESEALRNHSKVTGGK